MSYINGINGYGNYGVGGYVPQRNGGQANGAEQEEKQAQNAPEYKDVDPNKVMEFLNQHNFFIAPTSAQNAENVGQVDADTQDRIAGYMDQFEFIFGIVSEEFGEEIAPYVMDLVMDTLMGLAD